VLGTAKTESHILKMSAMATATGNASSSNRVNRHGREEVKKMTSS
jgi:hypothetical protein